jgi:hypothetical protein
MRLGQIPIVLNAAAGPPVTPNPRAWSSADSSSAIEKRE